LALTFVLSFLLCISVLSGAVWLTQLIAVRRQLKEMAEALSDIQAGNGNRKILAPRNDLTAELSYKLNEIVYCYEQQIYKLKAEDEATRQLMTSLSHDIRTPLTTLIGYLDAVHKGIAGPEEHGNYIETARLKAHSLKEYIDLLFDWFKLNSNEFTLSSEKIQLTELTRNILINWIPVFEENQIQYDIDIPEKPVFIHADPDGYERIINNLIQNVIKHSHASKITIEISKKESNITIQIEDNGIGIDQADLPYIFERLYKCDKGRSDKGSGLGLSIARQLTEKMNGWIDVTSKSDHYTAFIIYFPAAQD